MSSLCTTNSSQRDEWFTTGTGTQACFPFILRLITSCHQKRAYNNYLHVATVAIVFFIFRLCAIFMHDVTLSRIVFVFGLPRTTVLNYYYLKVRVFLPISETLFITYMRSINCLSFRAIMDLAHKFEEVACETTISVADLNCKYRILRAKRLTTRFGTTDSHRQGWRCCPGPNFPG